MKRIALILAMTAAPALGVDSQLDFSFSFSSNAAQKNLKKLKKIRK